MVKAAQDWQAEYASYPLGVARNRRVLHQRYVRTTLIVQLNNPTHIRGFGGSLRMAAQAFPDLRQAGDCGLERSRCVVVRRLDVGALRHRG